MYAQVEFGLCDEKECISIILDNEEQVNEFMLMLIEKSFIYSMNYLDVIDEFEKAGFVNVTTNVKYDIVTGWLTDDGEVKSVSINGDKKFDSDDKYRLDAEVFITYHTWKKNRFK